MTAYVSGVPSFTDDDSRAGLTAGGGLLTFFADDAATGGRADQPGFVRRIRTYDTVLAPDDVAALAAGATPSPVPVSKPATPALLGTLLGTVGLARWRVRRMRRMR